MAKTELVNKEHEWFFLVPYAATSLFAQATVFLTPSDHFTDISAELLMCRFFCSSPCLLVLTRLFSYHTLSGISELYQVHLIPTQPFLQGCFVTWVVPLAPKGFWHVLVLGACTEARQAPCLATKGSEWPVLMEKGGPQQYQHKSLW